MGAVDLINVLMIVGLFYGDSLVQSGSYVVTQVECEAAIAYAAEKNAETNWFWDEDQKDVFKVRCLPNPDDREV